MMNKARLSFLMALILLASCSTPIQTPPTKTPTIAIISANTITTTPTLTPFPTQQSSTCNSLPIPNPETISNSDAFSANQKLSRTMNLGEAYEFPDQGHSNWLLKEETFYFVKAAGFTAVRLPVDFAIHSDTKPPYTIQSEFWKNIDTTINYAIACHLVVIVNMHNFRSEAQIPYSDTQYFLALWNQISEHFKDYPDNILYFELYNEPGDPGYWNTLVARGVATIRKDNPARPIVVDLADWAQISGLSKLSLPKDQNLIISFHYYSPIQFTHQGAPFIKGAQDWRGTTWDGTPDQLAVINQDFESVAAWAKKQVRPVFLGEFGAISVGELDSRVRWTMSVRESAENHGFSWGYWDLCDTSNDGSLTMGILRCYRDPINTWDWKEQLLNALIPTP